MSFILRIGSRPSKLALAQAQWIRARLMRTLPDLAIEIVQIRTSGDRMTAASLAQVGGKGLFIRELEQALAAGQVDIAVHSMKDLPARLAPGFRIAAVPERENPRDALVVRRESAAALGGGSALAALAPGARLGTSSARRRFEAARVRNDLVVVPLRGNVDTRLARVAAGALDAAILAMAGLNRLGAPPDEVALVELDERDFVPAGGQGALCVEAVAGRPVGGAAELDLAIGALDNERANREVASERAFLAALGASCVSPVGVKATSSDSALSIHALLFSLDGARHLRDELSDELADRSGASSPTHADAQRLGTALAERMFARGARSMLADG